MNNNYRKRKPHKFLKVLLGIVLMFTLIIVAGLWGGNSSVPTISAKTNILDKINNSSATGGKLELTSDDLNYAIKIMQPSNIKKGDFVIDTVYVKVNETDITVYARIKYRNIPLLISSKEQIKYNDKYITINPLNFKIGLIPLPRYLLMDTLKKQNIKNIGISDKSIEIDKRKLSINVKTIEINNDKVIMTIPKLNIISSIQKAVESESKIYNPPVFSGNIDKNIGSSSTKTNTDKASKKNPKKITAIPNRKAILEKASGQLSAAAASVNSSSARRIIGYAQSAINKMINDPNYGYQGDLMSAKALYDKLNSAEQEKIKAAIFANVDTKALLNAVSKK